MKRVPIRKISDKRAIEIQQEAELRRVLYIKQKGLCADCGGQPDWRGWQKHEIVFRSQGGSPIDEKNCILICYPCGAKRHNIREK